MFARHSARPRALDSRINAARSTSGSCDSASRGCRSLAPSAYSHAVGVRSPSTFALLLQRRYASTSQLSSTWTRDRQRLRRVRTVERCIVQKDEIAIVLMRCLLVPPTHEPGITLLPDCEARLVRTH